MLHEIPDHSLTIKCESVCVQDEVEYIQSHICEQKDEVEYTLGLFPDHENCASIFDKNDLLTEKVCVCVYSECT